ncbi:MAG: efflux RND transporter periplasmic adaptor subunit [Gammaproteobacteria bacterium]|nr:MAG: efflux RND transporter periplasmic adaptor subunit [Gammaproteobacteria bacterium]
MKRSLLMIIVIAGLSGCEQPEEVLIYESAPVVRRDIVVAVEAAGTIEPFVTVEVKSKASGEILSIKGETGDIIERRQLLVQIDKRSPTNQLAQADAELEAAQARQGIAAAQSKRAKTLFESGTFNEVDYEQTVLEYANAKADVIRSEVAVENARIALDDTDVRAPITGTIIERLVETGQVISSPTQDVGGGTALLTMADLTSVQVKALVDETDIGKVRPGQPVTVEITAYPNQPFDGEVAKIEPKAVDDQTVTTFSVLIVLDNSNGLLRPGMNADIEIRIAERRDVIAVPTAALRVDKDIDVSSQLVGLTREVVTGQLRAGREDQQTSNASRAGNPAGYQFSSRYWVFVDGPSGPRAVNVVAGLTDMDYSEVLSGLNEGDRVLMLPSSGLIRSQQRFQAQMRKFMGMPGMNSSKENGKSKD